MPEQIVKVKDLVLDSRFYPREKASWYTIAKYKSSMEIGDKFPPVLVGVFKGKKILVDGWHRFKATQKLKKPYINAIVKNYKNEKDLLIDSIKANSRHGKPYTVEERIRLIGELRKIKVDDKNIQRIMGLNIEKWDKISVKRTIELSTGEQYYLKKSMNISDKEDMIDKIQATDNQVLGILTQRQLVNELKVLLENKLIDRSDEVVMKTLKEIKRLIK